MANYFSPALNTILSGAIDKIDWSAKLITALGKTRTLVIKHDSSASSNATAAQVWTSGTTVYSASLTGDMTASLGNITGFGYTSLETVNSPADLNVGAAVIRVTGENTNHWWQATLGLPGSGRTFIIESNLDGVSGLGFLPDAHINAPSTLPAGDPTAPYKLIYQDWSSGSLGTRQTVYFDEPQANIVFEDVEKNAELGPIPYTRSTQVVSIGSDGDTFDIGFHRFKLPASCNDEGTDPVYQVLIPFSPGANRWASYPAMNTYNASTDNTFMPPFKIVVEMADGSIWHTFQMRDGLPVNSPSLSQTRDATHAWRPHVHVSMMLQHTSHRLAVSTNARKYYAGTDASKAMRPKQYRKNVCSNAAIPSFGSERSQYNGFLQLMAMPRWAMIASSSTDSLDPLTDPYLDPPTSPGLPDGSDGVNRPIRAVGWDYEPGAMNCAHDWYAGPGGQRFNRFHVPSILAMYMTDPTGVRVQGNVPYRTLLDAYGKGFFNHGHHYVRDAKTLEMLPTAEAAYGQWKYAYGYYNPQTVSTGLDKKIHTQTIPNGGTWPPPDKNGKHHYHGWMVDHLHAYESPGWFFTHFNSVAHAISQKMRYFAVVMSATTNAAPGTNPIYYPANTADVSSGFFLTREHAWRWLPLVFMWKQASAHPLLMSRADVEKIWQIELESVYDNVVVPATTPSHAKYNSLELTCLRNLGMVGMEISVNGGVDHRLSATSDSKLLYLFGVLVLMKTTGCMAAMRNKTSADGTLKCNAALDFILNCLGKYTVTQMLATEGRNQDGRVTLGPTIPASTPITVPADWYEWAATRQPDDGSDLVTNADGTPYQGEDGYTSERSQYQHLHMQAIYGFRDHFPELNFPGVAQACTMIDGFEQTIIDRMNAGTGYEYKFRFPAGFTIALP